MASPIIHPITCDGSYHFQFRKLNGMPKNSWQNTAKFKRRLKQLPCRKKFGSGIIKTFQYFSPKYNSGMIKTNFNGVFYKDITNEMNNLQNPL